MSEFWAYVKLFILLPVAIAAIYHGAVYMATGKLPKADWSDNQTCGSGRLKYDC